MVEFTADGVVVEGMNTLSRSSIPLWSPAAGPLRRLLESALAQPDTPLCRLRAHRPGGTVLAARGVSAGERFDTEPATLAGLIEAQVACTPDAVPSSTGPPAPYAEINAAANRVAHRLIARGSVPRTGSRCCWTSRSS